MGKPKLERQLSADAALAKASSIRTSARKLNLVAASIRGKNAAAAMTQLTFEKRRIAQDVKKVLQSAIANAENNHALDVDKLYVAEAWVGRSFVMKRFHTRGRGKSAGIEKPFSNLTIIVRERADEAKAEKPAKTTKKVAPEETAEKPVKKAPAKKKTTTKIAAAAAQEA
jgi:large subunit ribosomal protein L22